MKNKLKFIPILLLPLFILGSVNKSDLNTKKIARTVAYSLPVFHLNRLPLNEYMSTNAFNIYIESLDPSHSYFLQSDIDEFSKEAPMLSKKLTRGDISFASKVYDTLMERIKNRVGFTEKLLKKGFDTSIKETFVWERKDTPWPANQAEWDEVWRKKIKNEYVARLVAKQVFPDTEEASTTNETASAEMENDSATNNLKNAMVSTEDDEQNEEQTEYNFDETELTANMTPEEFILNRYEQFTSTMESFDEEMLLQRYLTSFSEAYDPHSNYMSPSSVEDFDINMKLSLVGIGAVLRSDEGAARIIKIIPGGPADQDGRLKPGDRIVAVGDGKKDPTNIMHWPLYKSVRLIRGKKNTTVELTIIPESDRTGTRTKRIKIVRDKVKLEDSAAKSDTKEIKLNNEEIIKVGIITLPDFYADFNASNSHQADARRTTKDVKKLIIKLKKEGIQGLIFDLRNNGGGSLYEAIETAGLFIPSGPIVQVKEQKGITVLPDSDPETYFKGPMVVLVNRLSASASEIFAAAMQDYERAIIVGDKRTHGKGTVQTLMPLGGSRSGSLKLTTAGFYRINGGSTQLKGVTPDIIIPSFLDVMGLGEDSLEHALPWDEIPAARYRLLGDVDNLIPILAEKSKERLNNNEEFKVFLKKRERLKKRYETKTVSLALNERIQEAETEKELDEIQNGAFLDQNDDSEKKHDLTLDESVSILRDIISLEEQKKHPQSELVQMQSPTTAAF